MLIIYAGKDIDKEKLEALLDEHGYPFKLIGDECLDTEIQDVLTVEKTFIPAKNNTLILIDGMDREEIKEFNRILSGNGFDIPRKAVITPSNSLWPLGKLIDEIDEEYAYFRAREELYTLLTNPDKKRLAEDPQYLKMMSNAYALLEDENADTELICAAIQIIKRS